jgi:hypothetical protein
VGSIVAFVCMPPQRRDSMVNCLLFLFSVLTQATVIYAAGKKQHLQQAQIVVCSNGTRLEPTLKEVLESLIPHNLPAEELAKLRALYEPYFNGKNRGGNIIAQQLMAYASGLVERVSGLTVPFRSLISDGVFSVDMTTDWFYFRDVLLIQQNFWFINALCAVIPQQLTAVRGVVCKCFVGDQLSPRDVVTASSRFANFHAGNAHQWCVRNPCTDRSTRDGRCEIAVDPFRTSCVLVSQSAIPASLAAAANGEGSAEADEEGVKAGPLGAKELVGITPFTVNLIK